MTIDELISQLSNSLTISILKNENISETATDWLFFLMAANSSKLLSINDKYVFLQFNEEEIPYEQLLETEKITTNVAYLSLDQTGKIDPEKYEGSDTLVMYDLIDNVGYPVLAMKLPTDLANKTEEAKKLMIKLYEESGVTTDTLIIETE